MAGEFEIIDAHQHVGSLTDACSRSGRSIGRDLPIAEDVAMRIRAMDAAGVDAAVLQPGHGYLRADGLADTMRVNDKMAECRALAPDRFLAVLGTVEPMHGERSLPEIERCRELGLDGIAWHHRFQGCFIDSPWMWPILEKMRDLSLVPLVHVNVESSMEAHWRLQRLAADFPDMTFLAMDGLWSYERSRQVVETASASPNIVWDFGGPVLYVTIEEWVERHGSTTLCFGADLAYDSAVQTRPPLLNKVCNARIGDEDRRNILGGNIRRIFGLSRAE